MTQTFHTDSGRVLAYSVNGTGSPVILLPGGPGIDPGSYFAGTVLGDFTHIVLHPRGTTVSDAPDAPDGYRIDGYINDLEQLRLHLALDRLTLYGSSHGASTALAYSAAYPARVERMVLAGGPARMDSSFARDVASARTRFEVGAPDGAARLAASDAAGIMLRSAQSETERTAATRTMIDTYVARPNAATGLFLDALARAPMNSAAIGPMAAELMGGLDLLAQSHEVRGAALVLTADLDVRVPAEHMELIADALPRADLIRFSDVGHLTHVERDETWSSSVAAFLGGARP